MIPFWKKILSWFYPINIEKVHSEISGELEVNLQYGYIVLDTKTANYSFGNLHLVFQEAIQSLNLSKTKEYKVLILGFGAGSIANILINEQLLNCTITGIELDKEITRLSKKYFDNNIYEHTTIVTSDALIFVENNKQQYDLIFIDLFINTSIPSKFQENNFLLNIKRAQNSEAIVLMNSMMDTEELYQNWEIVFKKLELLTVQENKVLIHRQFTKH